MTTIGTATYGGSDYNLIWEDDQDLVWLDYTNTGVGGKLNWDDQNSWANNLGDDLSVVLSDSYTVNTDFTTGWRLPSAFDDEFGHLYESMGGSIPGQYVDPDPFTIEITMYWSMDETTDPLLGESAWQYSFHYDSYDHASKGTNSRGLAVIDAQVSSAPVPEPTSLFLLASGLAGMGVCRKRFRDRIMNCH